jgi:dTDP-D-glucose 4,6-dehydratase
MGSRVRNSDNGLIAEKLGWKPQQPLFESFRKTYAWIEQQVSQSTQV